MASRKQNQPPVPERIFDKEGHLYIKGKFLGRGGFARCYEFIDQERRVFAGKAVAKCMLQKPGNREKMVQEVSIHRLLNNKHVVQLYMYLEDLDNVYMLLELCSNRSMMEMQKRRGHVTEPEARYYMKEIVSGVAYLHDSLIIHRDLKLGNIFLDKGMHCKIGDFGLATKLKDKDERKDTVCGTPNYIAPEMLQRQKHSFEVDIWALGCILYTLLCGHPPFETTSLQATYAKIKNNSYRLPAVVGVDATVLIRELLHPDFRKRPNIHEVSRFKFWNGYCPDSLPVSCLTVAPKINEKLVCGGVAEHQSFAKAIVDHQPLPTMGPGGDLPQDAASMIITTRDADKRIPKAYASLLTHQLKKLVQCFMKMPSTDRGCDVLSKHVDVEFETPRFAPPYFITRWVDYSDKYGLGYQLADNSVGVLFNDGTKVMLDAGEAHLTYIERDGREMYYKANQVPQMYAKKMQLLNHFKEYMREQLLEAGKKVSEPGAELARPPFLSYWFRLKSAIVLHFTNGILQINFFDNHLKLVFCPMLQAVTVITHQRTMHTYSFDSLSVNCSNELAQHIQYCSALVERLVKHYPGPDIPSEEAMKLIHG